MKYRAAIITFCLMTVAAIAFIWFTVFVELLPLFYKDGGSLVFTSPIEPFLWNLKISFLFYIYSLLVFCGTFFTGAYNKSTRFFVLTIPSLIASILSALILRHFYFSFFEYESLAPFFEAGLFISKMNLYYIPLSGIVVAALVTIFLVIIGRKKCKSTQSTMNQALM